MPLSDSELHRRLRAVVVEAERNSDLHQHLKSDPGRTLAVFGITTGDVSRVNADDDDPPDPGCADGTCFSSQCPDTCFVTICSPSGFIAETIDEVVNPVQRELGADVREREVGGSE